MAPSKTAGGQEPSEKFLKRDAAGMLSPDMNQALSALFILYSCFPFLFAECLLTMSNTAKGLGAENAPAHKEASAPGEAPVASDSGLAIQQHPEEEAAAGTGNVTANGEEVGTAGVHQARPGGAAKGPNLAGPA